MAQEKNTNNYYKCPHCPSIFFTRADLQKHMQQFGEAKAEHEFQYRKVHGRLEHGFSEQ